MASPSDFSVFPVVVRNRKSIRLTIQTLMRSIGTFIGRDIPASAHGRSSRMAFLSFGRGGRRCLCGYFGMAPAAIGHGRRSSSPLQAGVGGQEIDLGSCTLAANHKQDRLLRPSPAMRPRSERLQCDLQRNGQHLYLKPICLQTL